MVNGQAGKGDAYRKVNREKYDKNFDKIFKNKETKNDTKKKSTRP